MADKREAKQPDLVDPGDLAGIQVGVSVSDSPDLEARGLVEAHLRLALGEMTRAITLVGGSLVYGGRLDPVGYTTFLQSELEKYSRRDRPLQVCLAWSEHRALSLADLAAAEDELGLLGKITYLDPTGGEIDRREDRGEKAEPLSDADEVARSLTAMRQFMVSICDTRVVVGGRRRGFKGRLPGVLEEAMLSIESAKPLFLAGGFGGITSDIASQLGLDPEGWSRPAPGRGAVDDATADALKNLGEIAEGSDWSTELNGLTPEESYRLATTHRPSEIASLVMLGMGRARKGTPPNG